MRSRDCDNSPTRVFLSLVLLLLYLLRSDMVARNSGMIKSSNPSDDGIARLHCENSWRDCSGFYVGSFFVGAVDNSVVSNSVHLRVSFRNNNLIDSPSCQHTFSQIELLNLHTAEHVWIHSIQTSDEETIPIVSREGKDSSSINSEPLTSNLPRQLHSSKLPGNSLKLGPGQVAIVPMTFLPRFPPTIMKGNDENIMLSSTEEINVNFQGDMYSTAFQQADWEDWAGSTSSWWDFGDTTMTPETTLSSMSIRNNLVVHGEDQPVVERYQVKTTILVDTDRGLVKLPVEASSVRQNKFGLPDVIYFNFSRDRRKHLSGSPSTSLSSEEQERQRIIDETIKLFHKHPINSDSNTTIDDYSGSFQSSSKDNSKSTEEPSASNLFFGSASDIWIVDRRRNDHLFRNASFQDGATDDGDPNVEFDSEANATYDSSYRQASLDCYDVYLKHPDSILSESSTDADDVDRDSGASSGTWLQVIEVLVSRPESTSLQVLSSRSSSLGDISPRQVVNEWIPGEDVTNSKSSDESLWIPADGKQHYVVTVCGGEDARVPPDPRALKYVNDMKEFLDPGSEETAMGFLQIRTNRETLLVALERGTPITMQPTKLKQKAENSRSTEEKLDRDRMALDENNNTTQKTPIIRIFPTRLDFNFMATTNPTVTQAITVENVARGEAVAIHRASIALQPERSFSDVIDMRTSSLLDDMGISVTIGPFHSSAGEFLVSGEKLVSAVTLSCTVDWAKFSSFPTSGATSTVKFKGALVVRGIKIGEKRKSESEVNRILELSQRSHEKDNHRFVVEIPLSLTIHNGEIGFFIEETTHPYSALWSLSKRTSNVDSLQSAFFPTSSNAIQILISEKDEQKFSVSPSLHSMQMETAFDGIFHRLGVFAKIEGFRVVLDQVEIASDESIHRGYTDTKTRKVQGRRCNRFTAKILRTSIDGNVIDKDLTDLGMIALNYPFDKGARSFESDEAFSRSAEEESDFAQPVICRLQVRTKPDTGVHEMPLVIFSGDLDISSETDGDSEWNVLDGDFNHNLTDKKDWNQHSIVGFDNLLKWFSNTDAGASLHGLLKGSRGLLASKSEPKILLKQYLNSLILRKIGKSGSQTQHAENNTQITRTRPILIKAGSIAHGDTKTVPIFFTNHNPIPITIRIEVGEVEGMSVIIGRDESLSTSKIRFSSRNHDKVSGNTNANILDEIPGKLHEQDGINKHSDNAEPRISTGRYSGQPLNGLRSFLLTDALVGSIFDNFRYHDAIALSEVAVRTLPILRELFQSYAQVRFHKQRLPSRRTVAGFGRCNSFNHPPDYGFEADLNATRKRTEKEKIYGPIIISSDERKLRRLPTCWDNENLDSEEIILPPGSIARFDVTLRAPPSKMLEKDITQFLTSGLVLSTNYGVSMPILLSFEALQAKLEVGHIPGIQYRPQFSKSDDDSVIQVPVGLFADASDQNGKNHGTKSLIISPRSLRPSTFSELTRGEMVFARNASNEANGVSLYMKSSFGRDIAIRDVRSCNPWFKFLLNDFPQDSSSTEIDPLLGFRIGKISNVISCDPIDGVPNNSTAFPSFFRCALTWLAKKSELQPKGCGTPLETEEEENSSTRINGFSADEAILAVKRALLISEWNDELYPKGTEVTAYSSTLNTSHTVKSGRRGGDGTVFPLLIETISEALNALQRAAEADLLLLRTSLRAIVEYNSTSEEKKFRRKRKDDGLIMSEERETQTLSVAIQNLYLQSVLETPSLFSSRRYSSESKSPEQTKGVRWSSSPIISFEPTFVGNVASLMIPVRNPTPVPIRVRLAVASSKSLFDISGSKSQPPYVQTSGKSVPLPTDYANQQWWDRGGAFFHPDFHGDLIRSHYNITIKSGSGALVSLVNPSFLSNTAFLVGCGTRCGLRNENKAKKAFESLVNLTPSSPIGASAAIRKLLIGHQRTNSGLLEMSQVLHDQENFFLAAGGSLIADGAGPSAFAIPHSALDEIIIPPFGEANIGPVFFRPPGRTRFMGCETISGSSSDNDCDSQEFESTIFLENSLSGLERLLLRGKAKWEKVVFVDPSEDEFGEIEYRYGRSALVFSGTTEQFQNSRPSPTLKEVLVQNSGDSSVIVSKVYFSPTSKLKGRKGEKIGKDTPCFLNGFKLQGCGEEATLFPFELLPKQNRSLFVEYWPKCTKRKEYIVLNLELQHSEIPQFKDSSISVKTKGLVGESFLKNSKRQTDELLNSFRQKKVELYVGYEMSDQIYSSCIPIQVQPRNKIFKVNDASERYTRLALLYSFPPFHGTFRHLIMTMVLAAFILWLVALIQHAASIRNKALAFHQILKVSQTNHTPMTNNSPPSQVKENWLIVFRCLVRADPSSSDLQNLGREQTRQRLLARYKTSGILPPQCFNAAGAARRERFGLFITPTGRNPPASTAGKGSTGTERIRTLSDAIFGQYDSIEAVDAGFLPCNLGWRTAAATGTINPSSLTSSCFQSKSKDLLLQRSRNLVSLECDNSIDVSDVEGGSRTFHESDLDSSYDNSSDPEGRTPTLEIENVVADDVEVDNTNGDGASDTAGKKGIKASFNPKGVSDSTDIQVDLSQNNSGKLSIQKDGPNKDAKDIANKVEKKTSRSGGKSGVKSNRANKSKSIILPPTDEVKVVVSKPIKHNTNNKSDTPSIPDVSSKEGNIRTVPQLKHKFTPDTSGTETELNRLTRKSANRGSHGKSNPSIESPGSNARENMDNNNNHERKKKQHANQEKQTKAINRIEPQERESEITEPMVKPGALEAPEHAPPISRILETKPSPVLRPPPGLPPPPGFGDSSNISTITTLKRVDPESSIVSALPLSDGVINQQPIPSPSIPFVNSDFISGPQIARSFSNSSAEQIPNISNPTPLPNSSVPRAVDFLYSLEGITEDENNVVDNQNSMAGFDVLDFLDGILNEGSTSIEDNGIESTQSTVIPGTLSMAERVTTEPGLLHVSANPWATDATAEINRSRAAAYGIAFEDPNDKESEETEAMNLPLLTPSTIFARIDNKDDDNTGPLY